MKSDRPRLPHRLLFAVALAAAVLVTAQPAHAAPTAADMETARTLFTEGKALRDKGDLPGALDRLRAAHALGRTPITGVELGRTLVLLGKLTEAREVLLEVAHIAVDPDESPARQTARKDAADLVESIRTRIPSLVISFPDLPPGTATPAVSLDGATLPSAAIALPRKVDPGPHELTATLASGPQRSVKVTARESQTVPVTFVFGADAQTPMVVSVAPARAFGAPATNGEAAHSSVPALTWVGIAVAGAGVIAGAVTGGIALSDRSGLDAADKCPDKVCTSGGRDSLNSARTVGIVSEVSFAVAGGGAVLAAVSFFTRSQPPPATAASGRAPLVEPWLGLGSAGLKGSF